MHGWAWETHTEPFSAVGHRDEPAHFVVEQIGDATFRPAAAPASAPDQADPQFGFQYNPPDGSPAVVVTEASLPCTDFASIPGFLSWFVSRAGRHTPAALVHDQLVTPGMAPQDRVAADDLFLEMMEHLDVPPVRRSVMWAAVSLATRCSSGWLARIGIALWGLLAAAGMVLLAAGLITGRPLLVVAALIGPTPASLLWGARRRAGLIAGYALPPVAFPAASSAAGYGAYWVIEELFRRLRSVPKRGDVDELPAPISYSEM